MALLRPPWRQNMSLQASPIAHALPCQSADWRFLKSRPSERLHAAEGVRGVGSSELGTDAIARTGDGDLFE